MFMGEYNHTVDAKGRLIVPSKFREQLGDEFVVTKGLDGCLFVYENTEWKALEEKLHALPLTNANARKFSRFFLAGATTCEVDKQGRILLPAVLREFAKIDKDAVLVGVGSRMESVKHLRRHGRNCRKYGGSWNLRWHLSINQYYCMKRLTA